MRIITIERYKEAEERFKESLERGSDQATTYNNLGKIKSNYKKL